MRISGLVIIGLICTFALLFLSVAHESRGAASEVAIVEAACATVASFGLAVASQPDRTCRTKAYYKLRDSSRAILDQGGAVVEIPLNQVIAARDTDYSAPLSEQQQKTLNIAYGVIAACFLGLAAIGVSLLRRDRT